MSPAATEMCAPREGNLQQMYVNEAFVIGIIVLCCFMYVVSGVASLVNCHDRSGCVDLLGTAAAPDEPTAINSGFSKLTVHVHLHGPQ